MEKTTKQDLIVKALKMVEESLELRFRDSEDIEVKQLNYHTLEVKHHTKHYGKMTDIIDLNVIR